MIPNMTLRMAQVAGFVAMGQTNKETAEALGLSIKTVEKHREKLMKTYGLRNTADITRFAIANNIITLNMQVGHGNN